MNETTPNPYWLAIDKNSGIVSYNELKHRLVIAQGWSELSLEVLIPVIDDNEAFEAVTKSLMKRIYPSENASSVVSIFKNLLRLKRGDVVVALEGTEVVGITEVWIDAAVSFRHDHQHEYANTVSYGSRWVDWSDVSTNYIPEPSNRGFRGIKNIIGEREEVLQVWNDYKSRMLAKHTSKI